VDKSSRKIIRHPAGVCKFRSRIDGNSIRATARLVDVSINSVVKLLAAGHDSNLLA
jgi:hypothetical protein